MAQVRVSAGADGSALPLEAFLAAYDAAKTRFHGRIHLIPVRRGDVRQPTGGIRGAIPIGQTR
jgi:hypothetical protein